MKQCFAANLMKCELAVFILRTHYPFWALSDLGKNFVVRLVNASLVFTSIKKRLLFI